MDILKISLFTALGTILYSFYLIRRILLLPKGDQKMIEIAEAISQGAQAYLKRQNKTVAVVAGIISLLLYIFLGIGSAFGFLLGAFVSATAGFIGMNVAVRSNVRTTQAAKKGLKEALDVAFKGGSVTGLLVAGLALLSICIVLIVADSYSFNAISTLVALGFGGSLISVFARLGGGIFTKGADVGTDMVGKIEKGIPEDDKGGAGQGYAPFEAPCR